MALMMPPWLVDIARMAQQAGIFRLVWSLPIYAVVAICIAAAVIVALAESAP